VCGFVQRKMKGVREREDKERTEDKERADCLDVDKLTHKNAHQTYTG